MRERRSRRRLPRLGLVLLAILAGLGLAVAIDVVRSGGLRLWLGRHGIPMPYVAAGERFDIGGRALYLDCRGEGSPTVVLEAGSGSDSATWSAVHDDLAATTRTCAYDRAGRARSDPRGRHTLTDAAADLRALLSTAGEDGPFLLVGHSLGGAYARVFAASYRSAVVGIVLVDTFDPDLQEDRIHPLLGALRPEYDANLDGLRDLVSRVDSLDWAASERQLRDGVRALAGLPIEVLVAPRREPRLDGPTNDAVAAAWIDAFESISPGLVRHTVAWGADHQVQVRRPDLVVEAARRLIAASRAS
jgi:pimeloyl-ACP methyl ester carboxylesterase